MILQKIALKNFRNYTSLCISPAPGLNILTGLNAQGKTNLLEAVFLCCTGRSHRTSKDMEMIKEGEDTALVCCQSLRGDGTHHVEIRLHRGARKEVKVNFANAQRLGELMGHVSGVLFSPEDLFLIKQGPSERRRFVDIAISQIKPSYFYSLQQYNRTLLNRNRLLKGGEKMLKALDVFDEQLSLSGHSIMQERHAFVQKLKDIANYSHLEMSGRKEQLTITCSDIKSPQQLYSALVEAREGDIKRKTTSVGPHRDDILIRINGKDARAYASQGQQRTAALSLKLAQTRLMEQELGEPPILMLDDVLSELDEHRRQMLFRAVGDIQILITCTDLIELPFQHKVFHVKNGSVEEA
jgi:DNA replication and repair protein RecF